MLMQIDGTFLFVVISFLIFLFIIKKILFQPITKVIDERNNFYAKNLKMETESKEKAKNLLIEKEEKIQQTRNEASNILKETNEQAKKESELKIKEAKKEAANKIEENQNNLNQEQFNTKCEIKTEISNIVKSMISKVLGEETEINLEEERINKYLKI
ncbi:ATP synthase F0 subunit B [bacterium]|nr:ATP synthase F0 subunit B [bacterium]